MAYLLYLAHIHLHAPFLSRLKHVFAADLSPHNIVPLTHWDLFPLSTCICADTHQFIHFGSAFLRQNIRLTKSSALQFSLHHNYFKGLRATRTNSSTFSGKRLFEHFLVEFLNWVAPILSTLQKCAYLQPTHTVRARRTNSDSPIVKVFFYKWSVTLLSIRLFT